MAYSQEGIDLLKKLNSMIREQGWTQEGADLERNWNAAHPDQVAGIFGQVDPYKAQQEANAAFTDRMQHINDPWYGKKLPSPGQTTFPTTTTQPNPVTAPETVHQPETPSPSTMPAALSSAASAPQGTPAATVKGAMTQAVQTADLPNVDTYKLQQRNKQSIQASQAPMTGLMNAMNTTNRPIY